MKTFKQFKNQWMKNPKFKREYDELGFEFKLVQSIIEQRIRKGVTQKALARKIGTGQSAIARLESGQYNPSISFLKKVSKALGAELEITFR